MPGTISRSEHDRIVREALAGVFALTPFDLYVYLRRQGRRVRRGGPRNHGVVAAIERLRRAEDVACLLDAAEAPVGPPQALAEDARWTDENQRH